MDVFNIAPSLKELLIGQDDAVDKIIPYLLVHGAGLATPDKPVANFMLMGPTGSGKTHTVEALAQVLHGSRKKYLRIDCGEFSMEHQVAKLLGSPPGYLGHKETQPLITQQKLNLLSSEQCPVTLVLFDEIEKASATLTRLLLGVMDKGMMSLGDNTKVNFENTILFFTSNLGATELRVTGNPMGFEKPALDLSEKRQVALTLAVLKKKFSPEFINRIDETILYRSLSQAAINRILDERLQEVLVAFYANYKWINISVKDSAKKFLLERGYNTMFGARHLKRVVDKHLKIPLVNAVLGDDTLGTLTVSHRSGNDSLTITKKAS